MTPRPPRSVQRSADGAPFRYVPSLQRIVAPAGGAAGSATRTDASGVAVLDNGAGGGAG